jgi:hypothetical protein
MAEGDVSRTDSGAEKRQKWQAIKLKSQSSARRQMEQNRKAEKGL